jgi:hypothetical protein
MTWDNTQWSSLVYLMFHYQVLCKLISGRCNEFICHALDFVGAEELTLPDDDITEKLFINFGESVHLHTRNAIANTETYTGTHH